MVMFTSGVSAFELDCQHEPAFDVGEKEYCLGTLNVSGDFKCNSYVFNADGYILQTNPQYMDKSDSLIGIFRNKQETREYFEPANQLVNVYYTTKNLHYDQDYTVQVICSSNTTRLFANETITLGYANLDWVFWRAEWGLRNISYIIAFGILAFILLLIGFAYKNNIK